MTINLAQIKQELFPGLRGIEGKYDMIPAQWKKYYETGNSEMAIERTSEMAFVGLAVIKSEGAPTSFDNAAGDRFVYNQEHVEIGLGYAITRKAIADNLYKSQFQPSNLGLMESAMSAAARRRRSASASAPSSTARCCRPAGRAPTPPGSPPAAPAPSPTWARARG